MCICVEMAQSKSRPKLNTSLAKVSSCAELLTYLKVTLQGPTSYHPQFADLREESAKMCYSVSTERHVFDQGNTNCAEMP